MSDFKPVKLRSPNGNVHTAHTPTEFTDLVYGQGYSVVGSKSVADVERTADTAKTSGGKADAK